jgi:hypothetical protein
LKFLSQKLLRFPILGLKVGTHLGAILDYKLELSSSGPEVGVTRHFCAISATVLETFDMYSIGN